MPITFAILLILLKIMWNIAVWGTNQLNRVFEKDKN